MGEQINPGVWFEIPTTDLERAQAFYEHLLGVELARNTMDGVEMAWFPTSEDGYGAAGTLIKGEGYQPGRQGTLVYLATPDIEAALARAEEGGGRVLQGKMSIGEYGHVALLEDSEGNRVGLHAQS